MYTYLKFGLPRVFPPNGGSQRSNHRMGPAARNGKGQINRGYRDSNNGPGAGSSGYDSSDNETPRGRVPAPNLRKFRSESDFRAIGGVVSSRPSSRAQHNQGGNIPLAALRQANSRASIAGTQINNHYLPSGKHYGNRSHSEADLLENDIGVYDYDARFVLSNKYMIQRREDKIAVFLCAEM